MKFNVTAADLRRVFPGLNLPAEQLVNQLNLDLGHLQLLRDCSQAWQFDAAAKNNMDANTLNQNRDFWVMLLTLISEVNDGSLCLPIAAQESATPVLFNPAQAMTVFNSQPLNFYQLDGAQILSFDGERLYFYKYHQAELAVMDALIDLVGHDQAQSFAADQVKQAIATVQQSVSFDMSGEQVLAMATCLSKPFCIISGGPGTGKTTIMGSVLRCLVRLGFDASDIALAAPTGRAAYRMTESLRHGLMHDVKTALTAAELALLDAEATTIHRLLGANPSRKQHRYHQANLLPYQVIVIDEVSMVDMMLMKQLLQAIPSGCRVILLGDQFQLPSVSSGAVLADLMPDVNQKLAMSAAQKTLMQHVLPVSCVDILDRFNTCDGLEMQNNGAVLLDCVTVLTDSKRCQADIAHLSELVRKGDVQGFMHSSKLQTVAEPIQGAKGFYWNDANKNPKIWQQHYLDWLARHYFEQGNYQNLMNQLKGMDYQQLPQHTDGIDQVFQCIQSNRILTLVNQGEVGTQNINYHVCEMMKHRLDVTGHEHLFHGAAIMVRRNDASLKLFNGDIGVLLEIEQGQLRAIFPTAKDSSGTAYQSYSIHVIPEFTAAFAMTVHKSQGSEFNHVLMPLPEDPTHRLLSREIIYTGMTRAKKSVQLVGNQAAIQAGIQRKNHRQTGLKLWE